MDDDASYTVIHDRMLACAHTTRYGLRSRKVWLAGLLILLVAPFASAEIAVRLGLLRPGKDNPAVDIPLEQWTLLLDSYGGWEIRTVTPHKFALPARADTLRVRAMLWDAKRETRGRDLVGDATLENYRAKRYGTEMVLRGKGPLWFRDVDGSVISLAVTTEFPD